MYGNISYWHLSKKWFKIIAFRLSQKESFSGWQHVKKATTNELADNAWFLQEKYKGTPIPNFTGKVCHAAFEVSKWRLRFFASNDRLQCKNWYMVYFLSVCREDLSADMAGASEFKNKLKELAKTRFTSSTNLQNKWDWIFKCLPVKTFAAANKSVPGLNKLPVEDNSFVVFKYFWNL